MNTVSSNDFVNERKMDSFSRQFEVCQFDYLHRIYKKKEIQLGSLPEQRKIGGYREMKMEKTEETERVDVMKRK